VSINTHTKEEASGGTHNSSDAALVVQSTSDNKTDSEVNENSLPSIAEAALKLEEPSNSGVTTSNDNDNQIKTDKQKR